MGIPDNSLQHLIKKISSWINWENIEMSESNCNMCFHCQAIMSDSCLQCHCQSCGRLFCEKCVFLDESGVSGLKKTTGAVEMCVKTCKLCFNPRKTLRRCSSKIYPSESPRQSPEPPSPSFSGEGFSDNPSPVSVRRSLSRSDEDEGEDSSNYFSASSEYYHDSTSDVDSVCVSSRHDFFSFTRSVGSSPSDSPSRIHITSYRAGHFVQQDNNEQAVLEKPAKHTWDPQKVDEQKPPQPLDFESNGLIWFPPPPDDEENSFFTYDDEDDDFGDSDVTFFPDNGILGREKQHLDQKEPLRGVVEGHFRLLVSQLLQGEKCDEEWINIITAISWKAANYIKPDTSRGGSMDPSDYVKVKCVASGSRSESKVIKGVVCTKNIKHKRMMSQYKNTRLLLLGGALEYQRDPNQLASFNTLLQQEKDHLKMIVSKIEAHHPNVLLVEKSVSSFAQDQLLEKEISLVLNVKRRLLERIARCTGAVITPSTDKISGTRLGHCELFHLEKITEEHEQANQFNRKPSKTLMFFEGCPRRLGCTVMLRGSSREELKKVKKVVQYAIFAAYHLSLETSFLADEGASLPTSIGSPVPDLDLGLKESFSELFEDGYDENSLPDEFRYRKALSEACIENLALDEGLTNHIKADDEYFSANDNNQSILVSFSSHSVLNGTICERPRLVRVKFYGPSDKPLGRYLRDDLFDKLCRCRSCKESCEAHAIRYTHQNGNLTINVRQISSAKLPGEEDGKIWMWHRCLKCTHTEGVPPATRRVIMSNAAWGLSFGKFLELSFSSHATGNRLATCGHSLQRDCLRFYGFGDMVAFFQYSPINVLSVCLPPSVLEFSCPGEQSWIRKEAAELLGKAKVLYSEISAALEKINQRSLSAMHKFSDASDLHSHVLELYNMVSEEKNYYEDLLQLDQKEILDILEINRLRHSLLIGSNVWDRRLYLLDSLLRRSSIPEAPNVVNSFAELKDFEYQPPDNANLQECLPEVAKLEPSLHYEENFVNDTSLERLPSAGSILSDQIDSAWSGADVAVPLEFQFLDNNSPSPNRHDSPAFRSLLSPTRVYSFDSAQILQERLRKKDPNSMHLSTLRSFHASGDYKYMVRDPVPNVQRTYSQISAPEAEKLNLTTESAPHSFISSTSLLPEGARLIVPKNGEHDIIVTVYDNEPTSIISHALSSKEYSDWILNKHPNKPERVNSVASELSKWHSFNSLDLDNYGSYSSEDESKSSPHLRISFKDNSTLAASGSVKFSVTCYFAKQFDALRRKSCPSELDFIRSLSRCMKWKAQGGKSNVYFAKSFDERFIIKQVTKTELESFDEFAPDYFKYLTDSLSSGSPTCLAKVLGLYQVSVKHSKGGKEIKMELMVMENLFFGRSVSKVYDLKGSERSRYNSDTTGSNKVLLDMNLLETLRTNPIFLGSKAKRRLERAVWNDTSFLASVDVMDYSLLVGVDEERKELVLGIIDYMRQYTWDKHLETWVKASGILGGHKNASPTIVSPKQYKKRFRKAMTTYFLTVPDQWSSQ